MWATLDIKYGILFPVRVWIESSSAKSMLGRQDKSGSRLAAGLALQLKKYLHLFGRLWNIGYHTTFSTCVPKVWELGADALLTHCLHCAHGRGFCCSALVGDQVWGHQNWSAATMCWGSRSPAGGSGLEFWQALSEVEEAKFCSAMCLLVPQLAKGFSWISAALWAVRGWEGSDTCIPLKLVCQTNSTFATKV